MPISQQRMTALIAAGQDYMVGFNNMQRFIARIVERVGHGEITPEHAIGQIQTVLTPLAFVNRPIESERVLEQEHYHFSRNYKRNEREARYAHFKRRTDGTPQARTAPRSLKALQPHGFRIEEVMEGSVQDSYEMVGRSIGEEAQWEVQQQTKAMLARSEAPDTREAKAKREELKAKAAADTSTGEASPPDINDLSTRAQSAMERNAANIARNRAAVTDALGADEGEEAQNAKGEEFDPKTYKTLYTGEP
jgi:hypothetical protein